MFIPDAYNMDEWLRLANEYYSKKCECGCDVIKQGIYGHSNWCPEYIAPVPVQDHCNCMSKPHANQWHAPDCKFRQWPEVQASEEEKNRELMKKSVDYLNSLGQDSYKRR